MQIAIIGAGFTGMAAASDLIQAGHEVTVFEAAQRPGGLAAGFRADNWGWPLEQHYHHVFATDKAMMRWLGELDLSDQLFFQDTQTYSLFGQESLELAQLDSALSLLRYPHLGLVSKLRTGATLAFLKAWPWGKKLERMTARKFLRKTMGQKAWRELWQPLFQGKFGQYANQVNAAWFWARIYARSKQLGYFKQGFQGLADKIVDKLEQKGVEFKFGNRVHKLQPNAAGIEINATSFDRVLFTGPSRVLAKLGQDILPSNYLNQLDRFESLSAMTLVLALDRPFFNKDIYWLNVNRLDWPFLAVVEHTNLIDPAHYGHQHLVYVGKYLPNTDVCWRLDKKQLLKTYLPYLNQLSPGFASHVQQSYLFKAQVAQPIVRANHSRRLPAVKTPAKNLYWASLQHVYPFDRGINYAIQLGRDTARFIAPSA